MMKKLELREMVLCALFIALITVGTFIRIPVGTDVYTLQFLFTLLAGLVLGARLGAIAVVAYILLGLLGVPIFATGGGPGYVLQPTFGYLLGFVLQAWFCGKYARRTKPAYHRIPIPAGRQCRRDGHCLHPRHRLVLPGIQLRAPGADCILDGYFLLRDLAGRSRFSLVHGGSRTGSALL